MVSATCFGVLISFFFFFKQKTAYEMRISDWSSDVCSSDLCGGRSLWHGRLLPDDALQRTDARSADHSSPGADIPPNCARKAPVAGRRPGLIMADLEERDPISGAAADTAARHQRSEEHTSELQSLMRISYAVFCLKKKNKTKHTKIQ